MDEARLMPSTEIGHSCLNSKCHFHDRERQKSSVRSWFNWWSVGVEGEEGRGGWESGVPTLAVLCSPLGKDVVGLSHKKIMLKYLISGQVWALELVFSKDVGQLCVNFGFRWYLPRHIQICQRVLELGLPSSSLFFYQVLRCFGWNAEILFLQMGSSCVSRGGWMHV